MTNATLHLLWHSRDGHPRETQEKQMPRHINDFPAIRHHPLFKCNCCMTAKCTYRPMEHTKPSPPPKSRMPNEPVATTSAETLPSIPPKPPDPPEGDMFWSSEADIPPDPRDIPADELRPGQMFQIRLRCGGRRRSAYNQHRWL
mmetsp:Transcript_4433/g.6564  ORF Transcript_4433/g.6564 Transcript_4433/m.6564 type:complete len:144 (+) Transcript_4433:1239-1670(+)